MFAPAILPASAMSTAGAGTRFNSAESTFDVDVIALRLLITVAWPVTTTWSSVNAARERNSVTVSAGGGGGARGPATPAPAGRARGRGGGGGGGGRPATLAPARAAVAP